jgi:hypothetical protein
MADHTSGAHYDYRHAVTPEPWGRILAPGGTKKILSSCRFHEASFDVIMG